MRGSMSRLVDLDAKKSLNNFNYKEFPMAEQAVIFASLIIGAFLMGAVVAWYVKDYVDTYLESAAYAKAVIHPEMLTDDGRVDPEELLYLRLSEVNDIIDDEDDD